MEDEEESPPPPFENLVEVVSDWVKMASQLDDLGGITIILGVSRVQSTEQ
jgi:hypothetical protein